MSLNPARRGSILMELADVYAAAIAGVSGANPWEGPTSVDPAESGSEFALQARLRAAENAELAGRTGWVLYLTTEAFHRLKAAIKSWIYQPLESQGEPVQGATTVDVTEDVRP